MSGPLTGGRVVRGCCATRLPNGESRLDASNLAPTRRLRTQPAMRSMLHWDLRRPSASCSSENRLRSVLPFHEDGLSRNFHLQKSERCEFQRAERYSRHGGTGAVSSVRERGLFSAPQRLIRMDDEGGAWLPATTC